jgi:hypothetical protein
MYHGSISISSSTSSSRSLADDFVWLDATHAATMCSAASIIMSGETFSPLMGWPGRAQRPTTTVELGGEASKLKEPTMHAHQQSSDPVATIGIDIGKNTFHLVGLDKRGAIVMRV